MARKAQKTKQVEVLRHNDASRKSIPTDGYQVVMETCWKPGVNNHGRWAFAEFTDVYKIQSDFEARVEAKFNKMIEEHMPTYASS